MVVAVVVVQLFTLAIPTDQLELVGNQVFSHSSPMVELEAIEMSY